MCFHELDQCPVGILNIAEPPTGISHVKGLRTVHGERLTGGATPLRQGIHPANVIAEVYEPEITPVAVCVYFPLVAGDGLDKLDRARAQEFGKGSGSGLGVREQDAADLPL